MPMTSLLRSIQLFVPFITLLLVTSFLPMQAQNPSKGRIIGSVVDSETGEAILGANVILEGTTLGAATDINGTYLINAEPGEYTLTVSVLSYAKHTVTGIRVSAGEPVRIDIAMKPEWIETEEVVVTAKMLQNTEATTLITRQRASAVSDAISMEMISRTGSSTAADAMAKVTGASVAGGKYVFIRGLGERYTSTHLNGNELPSADPDKRTFQMDLFPSNLLENIVTLKSFTPDKPGNFSGGIIDIGTVSFPEKFLLKLSSSGSFNSQTTMRPNFLGALGASSDWMGQDNGTRSLPSILSDPDVVIPDATTARTNPDQARYLDAVSKSFNPQMAPLRKTAPFNQKYSISIGDRLALFGAPLGILGSFSYAREYSFYERGTVGRWKLTGSVDANDALTNLILLDDTKGTDEVSWGGLATVNLKPHANHEITGNLVYTRSGETTARHMIGPWPEQLSGVARFETRVVQFTERDLTSLQIRGKHALPELGETDIEWSATSSSSMQNEPDARFFSNTISQTTVGGRDTTLYSITPSLFPRPARYFRSLDESGKGFNVELSVPFHQWSSMKAKIKVGGAFQEKERSFQERRFEYRQAPGTIYAGDPEFFFSHENSGIIGYDSTRGRYIFGNYIANAPDARGGNYDGYERILAVFGMVEIPLTQHLRMVSGLRYEITGMDVSGKDTVGTLRDRDILPSVNFIYQLTPEMNLRASYGKTLARPNFREKAPYASYSFANDFVFLGNVSLKRTLIDNFDLRWEWFARPGEIFAVSAFYKSFKNPIERVINVLFASEGGEILYANVDKATVQGLEFEARTRLDAIHPGLQNFTVGGNLSIIASKVSIPEGELIVTRDVDPSAPSTRQLQGQSPYLLNLNLAYDNAESGTSASIFYNVFGDRLAEISLGGTPDVFERSRPMLDASFSQKVFGSWSFNLGAKNLLNSKYLLTQTYKGQDFVRAEHTLGVSVSAGVTFFLD